VVALKRGWPPGRRRFSPGKQERRGGIGGGIETEEGYEWERRFVRSRNAVVALKSSFDGLRAPGNAPPQSGNVVVAWRMSNPGKA
jgi:hypothetical protein